MVRTIEIPGDQIAVSGDEIKIHADVGSNRVLAVTLIIEESQTDEKARLKPPYERDPFGKELDDLLAMTDPVEHFVDDSREAIYTPDEDLPRKNEP